MCFLRAGVSLLYGEDEKSSVLAMAQYSKIPRRRSGGWHSSSPHTRAKGTNNSCLAEIFSFIFHERISLYLSEVGLSHPRVFAQRFIVRVQSVAFVLQRFAQFAVGKEVDRVSGVLPSRKNNKGEHRTSERQRRGGGGGTDGWMRMRTSNNLVPVGIPGFWTQNGILCLKVFFR